MFSHLMNSSQHARFKISCAKRSFHPLTNFFPDDLFQPDMNASIGNDLYIVICQQQVNQHAVIVFGIPNMQVGKHLKRTLPCGLPRQQRCHIQRCLHRKAELPIVPDFGSADGSFNRIQRALRENAPQRGSAS